MDSVRSADIGFGEVGHMTTCDVYSAHTVVLLRPTPKYAQRSWLYMASVGDLFLYHCSYVRE